ncbi:hypothetical protein Hanom_Chr09g00866161 [Helianthus anomalus]
MLTTSIFFFINKGKKRLKAVQNVKHRKKITRNARKVSGVGMDPEFFNFSNKEDYRLQACLKTCNLYLFKT